MSYSGAILTIDTNKMDISKDRAIKENKKVKQGDVIGYTGSTGNSYQGKSKNHLHFGIKDKSTNKRIAPYSLIPDYITFDPTGKKTSALQDGVTPSSKWE